MAAFRSIALLHSHPRIPLTHDYYITDLVELCGLAARVRDLADDVAIPVTPNDRDPLGAFERFVQKRRPELVGISCFTCGASSARAYAEIAKRCDAVVVMGGYHPSALPEEVLTSPHVDAVVRGEGEETFAELVEGVSLEAIEGLSYRTGSEITHNPDRALIDDLDALPLPLREIRPPRFGLAGYDYHADTIYASRGCRASCSFCANHLVGKRWRQRSNEGVIEELLTILPPRRGPWKHVKFWDPNFLTDPERVAGLCDLILEHGLDRHFRFIIETRVEDVIRAEGILRKMRSAGFTRIGCGIESPNRETHKLLRKGLNLSHVQRAVDSITAADILVSKFLIIGHANEDANDILEYPDYSLAQGVELQNTNFMAMTPYPGTDIARHYREQGLLKSLDWDLYTNLAAVVEPPGISTLGLQTLLGAVKTKYDMCRRFMLGKPFGDVVVRLFEGLLVQSIMARVNREYSEDDIEASLWQAFAHIGASKEWSRGNGRRPRLLDRVAFRFHYRDRFPIIVAVIRNDDRELLAVREQGDPEIERAKLRSIHVSLSQVAALTRRIDLRRTVHDVLTLSWAPRAFRLRWLPGLSWNLSKMAVSLAGMAVFHFTMSVRRFLRKAPSPRGA